MTHEELAAAFESATLDLEAFGHTEHIRLAWYYLDCAPLLTAAQRMSDGLRRFTAALGVAEKYHETVTLAWLFVIHERRQRNEGSDWDGFRRANPDLFKARGRILEAYYRSETLASPLARRAFLLPDRGRPAPAAQGGERHPARVVQAR